MNIPYHFVVPILISIIVIAVIIWQRKKLFTSRRRKLAWGCAVLFFLLYTMIIGGAMYFDISYEIALQKFDLNGDGFFSGDERTPEQAEAMKKVVSDNARNFAFLTGLVFSGILSLLFWTIGMIYIAFTRKKNVSTEAYN